MLPSYPNGWAIPTIGFRGSYVNSQPNNNGMIGSLIQGGSSILSGVIGGLFGNAQQKRANEMNYKIWQEQKEFNSEEAQKSRDFEEYMWNKNNEYNTASAQRERLEEAGLNPYLMLNGGSAGVGMGISGSASANAGNAPNMQAYNPQGAINTAVQGVIHSVDSLYENKLKQTNVGLIDAQREAQEKENQYIDRRNEAQIAETLANAGVLSEQEAALILGNKWLRDTMDERVRAVGLQNQEIEARIRQFRLSADNQEIINKYTNAQQQAQLDLASAQIYELYRRGMLHEKEAQNAIAQAWYYTWLGNGAQLDFNKAMELAKDWIETEREHLRYQRGTYKGRGNALTDFLGITGSEQFGRSVSSASLSNTLADTLLKKENRFDLFDTRRARKFNLFSNSMKNLSSAGKDSFDIFQSIMQGNSNSGLLGLILKFLK